MELLDGWWADPRTYPSQAEKTENVKNLVAYFRAHGWTDEAIAGLAGNTEVESRQNPGLFETRPQEWPTNPNSYKRGIGLTQWTSSNAPPQKLVNWAETNNLNYQSGWVQCFRIYRECINNYQWVAKFVGVSFYEWSQMHETPERMAEIFERAYERAKAPDFATRRQWARYYYDLMQTWSPADLPEVPPDPEIAPTPPPGPEVRLPIWLLFKFTEVTSNAR